MCGTLTPLKFKSNEVQWIHCAVFETTNKKKINEFWPSPCIRQRREIKNKTTTWWQLIRYSSRACAKYSDFLHRAQLLTQKLLKQGYVAPRFEAIATNILRSSSQSDWPLRNIHISNDNGSFTFYIEVFLPLSLLKLLHDLTLYMGNTTGVL